MSTGQIRLLARPKGERQKMPLDARPACLLLLIRPGPDILRLFGTQVWLGVMEVVPIYNINQHFLSNSNKIDIKVQFYL